MTTNINSNANIFPLKSITGASITGKYFTRISQTQMGNSIRQQYGGGYWEIQINLLRKSRVEHDNIFAFLNEHHGQYHEFLLQLPEYSYSKSTYRQYINNILIDNINNSPDYTESSLPVYNLPASLNQILHKGDFIQFENHSKVYILTQDLNSNLNGQGILHLAPNILTTPVINSRIIYDNITWTVINTTDDITLNLDLQMKANWSLTFREVFE